MYEASDTMESSSTYTKGDIVWVKLSSYWWPGEVKNEEDLPGDLLSDFKKPPLVIVKFFDEDSYEYVKNWININPYNCPKKSEFIKKGMAGFRSKLSHMAKFPKDIGTAEEKTNGNPNILSQPEFLPVKKINYDEIFGTPSPKKSAKGKVSLPSSKKTPARDNNQPHITHRRFLGNDDYRAYICIQYPGKDRKWDSDDEEIKTLNEEPEKLLTCQSCSFKTKRLEVMILHTKMHIQGIYITSKRKTKKPKGPDITDSESDTAVTKSPKPKQRKKKEVKPKTTDVFTNLLEEWDDTDEEIEETKKKPPKAKKKSVQSEKVTPDRKKAGNKDEEGDQENKSTTNNIAAVRPGVTEFTKPEATVKNTHDDIKNCFDFDEEEEDDDILLPASTGRKIPRVIPEKPKPSISELLEQSQKEDELDIEKASVSVGETEKQLESANSTEHGADVTKKEILRISQSFNRSSGIDESIENTFKELMEETELPALDDLAQNLKPEQNFHDARTVKFPDKGGTASKGDTTPKCGSSRKRFVTSFEDFEAGFRKIEDEERIRKQGGDKEVKTAKTSKTICNLTEDDKDLNPLNPTDEIAEIVEKDQELVEVPKEAVQMVETHVPIAEVPESHTNKSQGAVLSETIKETRLNQSVELEIRAADVKLSQPAEQIDAKDFDRVHSVRRRKTRHSQQVSSDGESSEQVILDEIKTDVSSQEVAVESKRKSSRRRTKQFVIEEDSEEIIEITKECDSDNFVGSADQIVGQLDEEAKEKLAAMDSEIEELKRSLESTPSMTEEDEASQESQSKKANEFLREEVVEVGASKLVENLENKNYNLPEGTAEVTAETEVKDFLQAHVQEPEHSVVYQKFKRKSRHILRDEDAKKVVGKMEQQELAVSQTEIPSKAKRKMSQRKYSKEEVLSAPVEDQTVKTLLEVSEVETEQTVGKVFDSVATRFEEHTFQGGRDGSKGHQKHEEADTKREEVPRSSGSELDTSESKTLGILEKTAGALPNSDLSESATELDKHTFKGELATSSTDLNDDQHIEVSDEPKTTGSIVELKSQESTEQLGGHNVLHEPITPEPSPRSRRGKTRKQTDKDLDNTVPEEGSTKQEEPKTKPCKATADVATPEIVVQTEESHSTISEPALSAEQPSAKTRRGRSQKYGKDEQVLTVVQEIIPKMAAPEPYQAEGATPVLAVPDLEHTQSADAVFEIHDEPTPTKRGRTRKLSKEKEQKATVLEERTFKNEELQTENTSADMTVSDLSSDIRADELTHKPRVGRTKKDTKETEQVKVAVEKSVSESNQSENSSAILGAAEQLNVTEDNNSERIISDSSVDMSQDQTFKRKSKTKNVIVGNEHVATDLGESPPKNEESQPEPTKESTADGPVSEFDQDTVLDPVCSKSIEIPVISKPRRMTARKHSKEEEQVSNAEERTPKNISPERIDVKEVTVELVQLMDSQNIVLEPVPIEKPEESPLKLKISRQRKHIKEDSQAAIAVEENISKRDVLLQSNLEEAADMSETVVELTESQNTVSETILSDSVLDRSDKPSSKIRRGRSRKHKKRIVIVEPKPKPAEVGSSNLVASKSIVLPTESLVTEPTVSGPVNKLREPSTPKTKRGRTRKHARDEKVAGLEKVPSETVEAETKDVTEYVKCPVTVARLANNQNALLRQGRSDPVIAILDEPFPKTRRGRSRQQTREEEDIARAIEESLKDTVPTSVNVEATDTIISPESAVQLADVEDTRAELVTSDSVVEMADKSPFKTRMSKSRKHARGKEPVSTVPEVSRAEATTALVVSETIQLTESQNIVSDRVLSDSVSGIADKVASEAKRSKSRSKKSLSKDVALNSDQTEGTTDLTVPEIVPHPAEPVFAQSTGEQSEVPVINAKRGKTRKHSKEEQVSTVVDEASKIIKPVPKQLDDITGELTFSKTVLQDAKSENTVSEPVMSDDAVELSEQSTPKLKRGRPRKHADEEHISTAIKDISPKVADEKQAEELSASSAFTQSILEQDESQHTVLEPFLSESLVEKSKESASKRKRSRSFKQVIRKAETALLETENIAAELEGQRDVELVSDEAIFVSHVEISEESPSTTRRGRSRKHVKDEESVPTVIETNTSKESELKETETKETALKSISSESECVVGTADQPTPKPRKSKSRQHSKEGQDITDVEKCPLEDVVFKLKQGIDGTLDDSTTSGITQHSTKNQNTAVDPTISVESSRRSKRGRSRTHSKEDKPETTIIEESTSYFIESVPKPGEETTACASVLEVIEESAENRNAVLKDAFTDTVKILEAATPKTKKGRSRRHTAEERVDDAFKKNTPQNVEPQLVDVVDPQAETIFESVDKISTPKARRGRSRRGTKEEALLIMPLEEDTSKHTEEVITEQRFVGLETVKPSSESLKVDIPTCQYSVEIPETLTSATKKDQIRKVTNQDVATFAIEKMIEKTSGVDVGLVESSVHKAVEEPVVALGSISETVAEILAIGAPRGKDRRIKKLKREGTPIDETSRQADKEPLSTQLKASEDGLKVQGSEQVSTDFEETKFEETDTSKINESEIDSSTRCKSIMTPMEVIEINQLQSDIPLALSILKTEEQSTTIQDTTTVSTVLQPVVEKSEERVAKGKRRRSKKDIEEAVPVLETSQMEVTDAQEIESVSVKTELGRVEEEQIANLFEESKLSHADNTQAIQFSDNGDHKVMKILDTQQLESDVVTEAIFLAAKSEEPTVEGEQAKELDMHIEVDTSVHNELGHKEMEKSELKQLELEIIHVGQKTVEHSAGISPESAATPCVVENSEESIKKGRNRKSRKSVREEAVVMEAEAPVPEQRADIKQIIEGHLPEPDLASASNKLGTGNDEEIKAESYNIKRDVASPDQVQHDVKSSEVKENVQTAPEANLGDSNELEEKIAAPSEDIKTDFETVVQTSQAVPEVVESAIEDAVRHEDISKNMTTDKNQTELEKDVVDNIPESSTYESKMLQDEAKEMDNTYKTQIEAETIGENEISCFSETSVKNKDKKRRPSSIVLDETEVQVSAKDVLPLVISEEVVPKSEETVLMPKGRTDELREQSKDSGSPSESRPELDIGEKKIEVSKQLVHKFVEEVVQKKIEEGIDPPKAKEIAEVTLEPRVPKVALRVTESLNEYNSENSRLIEYNSENSRLIESHIQRSNIETAAVDSTEPLESTDMKQLTHLTEEPIGQTVIKPVDALPLKEKRRRPRKHSRDSNSSGKSENISKSLETSTETKKYIDLVKGKRLRKSSKDMDAVIEQEKQIEFLVGADNSVQTIEPPLEEAVRQELSKTRVEQYLNKRRKSRKYSRQESNSSGEPPEVEPLPDFNAEKSIKISMEEASNQLVNHTEKSTSQEDVEELLEGTEKKKTRRKSSSSFVNMQKDAEATCCVTSQDTEDPVLGIKDKGRLKKYARFEAEIPKDKVTEEGHVLLETMQEKTSNLDKVLPKVSEEKNRPVPPKKNRWSRRDSYTTNDDDSMLKKQIVETIPESEVNKEVVIKEQAVEVNAAIDIKTILNESECVVDPNENKNSFQRTNVIKTPETTTGISENSLTDFNDSEIILPPKKSKRVSEINFNFLNDTFSLDKKADSDILSFPSCDDSIMSTSLRNNIEGLIKDIDSFDSTCLSDGFERQSEGDGEKVCTPIKTKGEEGKSEPMLLNAFSLSDSRECIKEPADISKCVPPKKKKIEFSKPDVTTNLSINNLLQNDTFQSEGKLADAIPQPPKKKIQKLFESQALEKLGKVNDIPLMSPLAKKKSFLFHQGEFVQTPIVTEVPQHTTDVDAIRQPEKKIDSDKAPLETVSTEDANLKPTEASVSSLETKEVDVDKFFTLPKKRIKRKSSSHTEHLQKKERRTSTETIDTTDGQECKNLFNFGNEPPISQSQDEKCLPETSKPSTGNLSMPSTPVGDNLNVKDEHTNEMEVKLEEDDFKFCIQTNLTNLATSRAEELSALATATLSEIKNESITESQIVEETSKENQQVKEVSGMEEEDIVEAVVKKEETPSPLEPIMPEGVCVPSEQEFVPISLNPTVMSEKDLADAQVEITTDKVISEKKPTSLDMFSMDFLETTHHSRAISLRITKKDVGSSKVTNTLGTEFTSKAMTKEFDNRPLIAQPKAYALKSELLDILEGNSNSSTNSSGSEQKFKTSFDNYDKKTIVQGMFDFEEAIPSQIVLSNKVNPETVLMDSPKLLERLSMSSDSAKTKSKKVVIQSDIKVAEGIAKPVVTKMTKPMGTPKPGQKIVIKTTKTQIGAGPKTIGNKPIILSEQIIRPANAPKITKAVIQPQGMKRQYEDIEDVETAFIIPKIAKKSVEEELVPLTPEKPLRARNSKISGKAKILQQTIITPKGEIIQPQASSAAKTTTSAQIQAAQSQPDDTVFDINSMPIVLSDDILTPESIQNMPVVLSDDVVPQNKPVSVKTEEKALPTLAKKLVPSVVTKQQIVFKTTRPGPATPVPAKQTVKPRILSNTVTPTSKLSKPGTTALLATGTSADGKPTKYVLVPSTVTPALPQVKTVKPPIIKKQAPIQSKLPNIQLNEPPSQAVGNKIMIVTNQHGQQTRVVLTPQQQKAFMNAQPGSKTKAIIKGAIPKALLESAAAAGPSGITQKPSLPSVSQGATPTISSQGGLLMTVGKGVKTPIPLKKTIPRTPAKPQKTILIKNQLGQTVRKIQGTDDADLDRQVAEQLEAIKASARLQQATKSPEIINYTNRPIPTTTPRTAVRRSYSKKIDPIKVKATISTPQAQPQKSPDTLVPALAPLSPQPRIPQVHGQTSPTPPKQVSPKKVEPSPPSPVNKALDTAVQQLATISTKSESKATAAPPSGAESKPTDRPLTQLVIQDGLGNQTTITEGQILAIPSETVDGQPQSYMLVTLDELGNITPLNNEALMSLDPSLGLGGDLNNMVLQVDQGQGTVAALKSVDSSAANVPIVSAVEQKKVEERLKSELPRILQPTKEPKIALVDQPKPQEVPLAVEQQIVIGEGVLPGADAGGQQLIVTGDPIATQKFLESLSDGSTDLANILANAEGGSVLIQADGQQILIKTNTGSQPLLGIAENTEGGGNPMFGSHKPNQDILAAALANTEVFQPSDQPVVHSSPVKGLQSQLSPGGGGGMLYPMHVGNVLETSLTLNSPIMTPLEVPSMNSKKIDDEADILNQVPKNVDLPITITDPNISQTVAQQQAIGLMELTLPISESTGSTDINSPSYTFSLPALDEPVGVAQKPFNGSMPLLTEDIAEGDSSGSSQIGKIRIAKGLQSSGFGSNFGSLPMLPETIESSREEVVKTTCFGEIGSLPMLTEDVIEDSGSSIGSSKPPRSSPKPIERDIVDEGLSTLGGEMCSSLSEPPPDMFDLASITAKEEEISSDLSSIPEPEGETLSLHSENSGEIPIQPPIVANLNDLKRSGEETQRHDEKRQKFD